MEFRKYLRERISQLRSGEALNVSETSRDGHGIRKVDFNPQKARSLVQVPYHKDLVFNLTKSFEGLDNFLRLEGYDRARIEKVHQALRKLEISPSSPRKRRPRDRDFVDNDKFTEYLVIRQDPAQNITFFTKNPDGSVPLFKLESLATQIVFWPEGVKGKAHYGTVYTNSNGTTYQTIPIGKFPNGYLGWGRTDRAQNLHADAFSKNIIAVAGAYGNITPLQSNSLTFVSSGPNDPSIWGSTDLPSCAGYSFCRMDPNFGPLCPEILKNCSV